MRRHWGIRRMLLLLGLAPAALIAFGVTLYNISQQMDDIDAALQTRGESMARQLAPASAYGVFSGNSNVLREITRATVREKDVLSAQILSPEGRVLARSYSTQKSSAILHGRNGGQAKTSLFRAPVRLPSVPVDDLPENDTAMAGTNAAGEEWVIGWVEIVLSHASTSAHQARATATSTVITLLGLLLTALWVWRLARSISEPVIDITQTVNSLRQEQLSARTTKWATSSELDDLGTGVNAMAERLERARDHLQLRVEHATAELSETIEAVEIQNVELDLARKRAIDANRVKSHFVANISHEVRTPLNGIIGFADLALQTDLDPEQQEYIGLVRTSANTLLDIINDLLDYSKIESGQFSIDMEAFDIRKCVEDAITLLTPLARPQGLELVILIYQDVPAKIIGDHERIRQIIINLAGNAIKFTPTGSVIIRVMLEDENSDEVVLRFSVTDTGIGLSEEFRARLFMPFSQEGSPLRQRYQGTGLGLAISKRLVEHMNGEIGAQSTPGEGSEFWFTLPAAKVPADTATSPAHDQLSGHHAWVCDRHKLARSAVANQLRAWDMEVTEYADPLAVLANTNADQRLPDILCLGLSYADLTDLDIQSAIAAFRQSCDTPLLLLASAQENEIHSRTGLPPSHCLAKPARRERLRDRLLRSIQESTTPAPAKTSAGTKAAGSHEFDGKQILVADDNEINRKLAATVLSRAGAAIIEACDGEEAVAMALAHNPDIILMDLQMPLLGGLDATRQIRAQNSARHIPIFAVTATVLSATQDELLREGFDGCLEKPFTANTLMQLINSESTRLAGTGNTRQDPAADTLHDLQLAIELAGGDETLARDLLRQLVVALPTHRDRINRALEKRDMAEIQEEAHALNGGVTCCGIPRLQATLTQLEKAAMAEDIPAVRGHIKETNVMIAALLAAATPVENHDHE